MANVRQHRIFHQGIRDFLLEIGIEPTKENVLEAKMMFKRYLKIHSVASLSDKEYSRAIQAVFMLMAREFGVEIPIYQSEKTMRELLKEINHE